jgi:hypothetical protein
MRELWHNHKPGIARAMSPANHNAIHATIERPISTDLLHETLANESKGRAANKAGGKTHEFGWWV